MNLFDTRVEKFDTPIEKFDTGLQKFITGLKGRSDPCQKGGLRC